MTAWNALVAPRLGTTDDPGMCLRFAQSFFGAPARHRSAWHAWLAQEHRYGPEVPRPDVPVLLWFEHWGAYNDGNGPYDGRPVGARGNWGHVAVHVPGDAIYTSPLTGTARGSQRYANIDQMAAQMNLVYVGWSADINKLLVAEPGTAPLPEPEPEPEKEEDDMYKPTLHIRTEGEFEATLAHPEIGKDLARFASPTTESMKRKDGKVTVFRGFQVTSDKSIYVAWARMFCIGDGSATSHTDRAGYIAIQAEATRLATESYPEGIKDDVVEHPGSAA